MNMTKKQIEKRYNKLIDDIESRSIYDGRGTVDRYECKKMWRHHPHHLCREMSNAFLDRLPNVRKLYAAYPDIRQSNSAAQCQSAELVSPLT